MASTEAIDRSLDLRLQAVYAVMEYSSATPELENSRDPKLCLPRAGTNKLDNAANRTL